MTCASNTSKRLKLKAVIGFQMALGILSAFGQTGSRGDAAKSLNDFTWRLNAQMAAEEGNVLYSPFSVHTALSMLLLGARGTTQKEIREVLRVQVPDDEHHRALAELRLMLLTSNQGDGAWLVVGNRLWAQQGLPFLPEFRQRLNADYGAELGFQDFVKRPEESRVEINEWISDQTAGTIRDMIPPDAITRETRLMLTNAIYFKASWQHPFDQGRTSEGEFTADSGKKLKVPFMRQTGMFQWGQTADGEVLEMAYRVSGLSMLVFMPTPGTKMKDCFNNLNARSIQEWTGKLEEQRVFVQMPRFKTRFRAPLTEVLARLGIQTAFGREADYSGMDGSKLLYPDSVYHEAFVNVTEEGTEASAVTASGFETARADHEKPRMFIVDRPFIFVIHDRATRVAIFLGEIITL